MTKQTLVISGNHFSNLEEFFNEIDGVFTRNLNWKTGHNLNAFNDLLNGGFGVYDYEEPVKVIWTNFSKSQQLLGQELVKTLLDIIARHSHIELTIEG